MGVHHSKCSSWRAQAMVKSSCCDIAQQILDAQPNWIARPSRRTKCPRHSTRVRSPTPYPRRKHRSPTPFPARDGQRLHQQLTDEEKGTTIIEIESHFMFDKSHPDEDIPHLSLPHPWSRQMIKTASDHAVTDSSASDEAIDTCASLLKGSPHHSNAHRAIPTIPTRHA